MFSINCLEITADKSQWEENKSLYKNLLSDNDYEGIENSTPVNKRFFFNDFYQKEQHGVLKPNTNRTLPENFFGKNINVQAIVGKNGSGKSTLMDLMYMAINNFSYMFERGHDRPGADPLYFIPNLRVTLHFTINAKQATPKNQSQECQLTIDDKTVIYKNPNLLDPVKFTIDPFENCFKHKDPEFLGKKDSEIIKLTKNFFYTIVSNYSIHSFVDKAYRQKCYFHENVGFEKSSEYDNLLGEPQKWINSIFHKNDGYVRSIVLNPFRENGCIDSKKENELAKDRIAALLLWSNNKHIEIFKNYAAEGFIIKQKEWSYNNEKKELKKVWSSWLQGTAYDFQKIAGTYLAKIFQQLQNHSIAPNEEITDKDSIIEKILPADEEICPTEFFSKKIIEIFSLNPENPFFTTILKYVRFKILKIIFRYDAYIESRDKIFPALICNEVTPEMEKNFEDILNKIKTDSSHITKKIRRAINFTILDSDKTISNTLTFTDPEKPFDGPYEMELSVESFFEKINNINQSPFNYICGESISPEIIDDCLFPSFISYELILCKDNNKINYELLSSGEMQFLQTFSIHLYHLANLLSVDSGRPKYENFNIVFDELEICLHPEFQRRFVNMFLFALNNMLENKEYNINIFIITHSPFVLSDIPRSNILYMLTEEDEGKELPKHTFAQNIGEMMYDSFFMEKTIGDFAEAKLKELIKWKQGKDSEIKTDEDAKRILNLIGDPVIKSLIEEIEKIEVSDD
jgi:energy-coupling factor transporter ATP-binding protein EcfA2